jgi:hypothetical protein
MRENDRILLLRSVSVRERYLKAHAETKTICYVEINL